MARFLYEKGADINIPNIKDFHCIHAATYLSHIEVVKMLVEFGVNINIKKTDDGFTCLHFALRIN
jgi:ankyrin repeat protein